VIDFAVCSLVDGRDLFDPSPPLGMLERQDRLRRPMKVVRDEGYLPVQQRQGVA
jgi:hypothetical protein